MEGEGLVLDGETSCELIVQQAAGCLHVIIMVIKMIIFTESESIETALCFFSASYNLNFTSDASSLFKLFPIVLLLTTFSVFSRNPA